MKASPRATIINPRVTMKAGTRQAVTITPVKAPQEVHEAHAQQAAGEHGQPAGLAPPVPARIATAVITAASASRLPTDRSMPAVTITIVMPMAMIAMAAFWLITFSRFCRVRKLGQR